jgi:hypothetical protein
MDYKKVTKSVTFIVMPLLIVILLAYDAFAIYKGGTESSISSLLITSAYKMPFMVFSIGFFFGLLCGHLFWRMKSNKDTKELGL